DEGVPPAHVLEDFDEDLEVGEAAHMAAAQRFAEIGGDRLGQRPVGIAGQNTSPDARSESVRGRGGHSSARRREQHDSEITTGGACADVHKKSPALMPRREAGASPLEACSKARAAPGACWSLPSRPLRGARAPQNEGATPNPTGRS